MKMPAPKSRFEPYIRAFRAWWQYDRVFAICTFVLIGIMVTAILFVSTLERGSQ